MPVDKRNKMKKDRKSNKKSNEQSDSDDDISFTSDSEEEEEEMDQHEYRKFLSKIFPSKYMNKKVSAGEKLKRLLDEEGLLDEEEEEEEEKPAKKRKGKKEKAKEKSKEKEKEKEKEKSKIKSKRPVKEEEEEEEEEKKINIIFTIGQATDDDEEEWIDEDDSDYDDYETEDEDKSVSSDDDSEEEDEESEESEEEESEEEEEEEIIVKRSSRRRKVEKEKEKEKEKEEIGKANKEKKKASLEEETLLQKLKDMQEADKDNELLKECLAVCQGKIDEKNKKVEKKQKKQKKKNGRIFKKLLRDKNTMNDFTFFEKMGTEEQVKIIKEVREINKIMRIEKPYRMTLLESQIPPIFKAAAMKKINSLRYMEPGSGEFYKIKNWVDTFMRIPFNKFETLPITIDNGVEECHQFMEQAQKTLDSAIYGLNDAKMQIMQMLGQLVTNPTSIGAAIAIHGPPGTGKTSLVKEGISKILNRPFAFIALGGATDSSFLEGHSYTYEGSVWGKIVQILIDSKCMNPVIYFDELDKISGTPKGEEIAGILTHLTDTSQNSEFHDKYFAEIDFDLSKCLFIFSYNDESLVNPILKDRMYRIQTKGYEKKQKTVIANEYLLPKIREQVRFSKEEILIPEESIHHIIENHCNKEDGVRNLKRCLEIIYTKLNLYRLMKPGQNLFEDEMSLKVEFPFTVTRDIVDKLIKKNNDVNMSMLSLYV
uniref:ATPase AAA-type core domain-containing protein n=1 Tax=viral metagenome TaxID=1070528 RepID=A0A6C0LFR0_9ZZZZ